MQISPISALRQILSLAAISNYAKFGEIFTDLDKEIKLIIN